MGVLIVAESPPAGSPYDQWRIYRATSKTGTYSLLETQNITDLSYYDTSGTPSHWYKISYYDSSEGTESALSDPLQGMAETYTTVKKVENFLHLTTITDSTTPNIQQVVELINRAEDRIDYATGHAWRTRYSGTTSGHDQTAEYEYYDIPYGYEYQSGRPIYLKHRKIKTLSASEGDALEIWNGSEWEDWLSNKTEGRANDFWVDYDRGIIYIKAYYGVVGPLKLRIKYRYGEDIVPKMVEDIATKMVAIDILTGESRAVMLPEGSSGLSYQQKIDTWKEQINETLNSLKEFKVMSIQS